MSKCPDCGGTIATRTSKRVGQFIYRRRRCKVCEREDVATVKPEEIISIKLLCTQQEAEHTNPINC